MNRPQAPYVHTVSYQVTLPYLRRTKMGDGNCAIVTRGELFC